MDSITASSNSGVSIPSYELVSATILQALEHASSIEPTFSDEAGEYYAMAMASSSAAVDVQMNAVIILPLTEPPAGATLDFTFLAASKNIFIQLHDKPQQRMTYGECLAYSVGMLNQPLPLGTLIKFPSAT